MATSQKIFGISSNDSILSGKLELKTFSNFTALEILSASTNIVVIDLGKRKSFKVAAVMMPNVPSAPMKRFFKSYPVLSFFSSERRFIILPSGKTTSKPKHNSLVLPYLRTFTPPAFVERLPPIIQEPFAPKFNGKNKSSFSTKSCICDKIIPDSTVIVCASLLN